jgi:predicted SnoaL-like aldol condensation-catalyzing enzyme
MTDQTVARVYGRTRSFALRSAFAMLGSAACSSDDAGVEAVSSVSPQSPEAAPGAAGQTSESVAPGVEQPTPNASELPAEGNPVPGSIDNAGAPSAEGGPLPPAGPAAGLVDAGLPSDVPGPTCERAVTDANKALVAAAIDELFVQGDIAAVDRYWGEPYLQHNPIAASGVAAFRNVFAGLISPGNSIYELGRVVGECELVLIHGNYTSFGGPTFDMFRVEGGRLVEHWDAAALGAGPNPSGHTALDGETVVRDEALTAQNEALVLAFVANVLVGQAYDAVGDYMSPDLIEHNPQSSDGSAAYVQYQRDQAITYRQVRHELGDGNFVFVLSEGAVGATDVAHYDLFRVEGGRIVEHWDGRREVPPSTASGLGIF